MWRWMKGWRLLDFLAIEVSILAFGEIIWRSWPGFWRSRDLFGARGLDSGVHAIDLAFADWILAFMRLIWRSRIGFWRSRDLFGVRNISPTFFISAQDDLSAFVNFYRRSRNVYQRSPTFISAQANLSALAQCQLSNKQKRQLPVWKMP
ncbi:hypothetical protein [Alkalibacillus haloalkaliphilus]|uniref:hypothetical protein n=1 Tax=Alkalibacillus haloalkaliphilus TaxID=94136 RepID=UPI001478E209|nr:hypothetical protein [Alkalibacillus haloalkaliphilus]